MSKMSELIDASLKIFHFHQSTTKSIHVSVFIEYNKLLGWSERKTRKDRTDYHHRHHHFQHGSINQNDIDQKGNKEKKTKMERNLLYFKEDMNPNQIKLPIFFVVVFRYRLMNVIIFIFMSEWIVYSNNRFWLFVIHWIRFDLLSKNILIVCLDDKIIHRIYSSI